MKKHEEDWLEQVSARLDGEAGAAPAHPEAEARLAEYAALGEMLRAMPGPEENPYFATRVLARVREEQHARPRWRAWFAGALLATAAAMALVTLYPSTAIAPAATANEVAAVSAPESDDEVDALLAALVEEEGESSNEESEAEGESEAEVLSDEWKNLITREVYAYVGDSALMRDEGEVL